MGDDHAARTRRGRSVRLVSSAGLTGVLAGSLAVGGGVGRADGGLVMVSGTQIAQIAHAQLGRRCAGNGWRCDPGEWCADFAKWVWSRAGANTSGITAASSSFVTYGRSYGTIVSVPQPGDAIVYGFTSSGWAAHVNLVYAVRADGAVQTIGGNQGSSPGIVSLDNWHSMERHAIIVQPVGMVSQIQEITGDWDGNGTSTPGSYQGNTFYLRNSNSAGSPDVTFSYGTAGWIPIAGDWTGSGRTSVGLYDPSTGTFHLRADTSPGTPGSLATFQYGSPGWVPVTGDWDGGGKTSVGVYDPSTGTFYLRSGIDPGSFSTTVVQFGNPGWVPVTGDWDGGGKTSVGVYDPSTGTFYLRSSIDSFGFTTTMFRFGTPDLVPLSGDWTGSGKTTIGAYNPATGVFSLRTANAQGNADITFRYAGRKGANG